MENLMAWHYTTKDKYHEIFKDGVLRPGSMFQGKGIKPILWFSLNQDWEKSAGKDIPCHRTGKTKLATQKEMAIYGRGLVRFGIHLKKEGNEFVGSSGQQLFPWPEILKRARIPRKIVMEETKNFTGNGCALWEWVGQFDPLPINDCDEIQIMGTSADDIEWRTIKDICAFLFNRKEMTQKSE